MKGFGFQSALIAAIWISAAQMAWAGDTTVEPFVGDYVGSVVSPTEGLLSRRELAVSVQIEGEGFTVDWTALVEKAGGRPTQDSYSIDFRPTGRGNIFASAMDRNKFGARVPMNPLADSHYAWARIEGDTLTVYLMFIADDGGYEIQTYDSTLEADGLALKLSRVRDGDRLPPIRGVLRKVQGRSN